MNLENLTKKQLIIECKDLYIKGYSNKKKEELIRMIKKAKSEQFERKKWVEEYNDSLPQHKFFDEEFQEVMSIAIGGIYDSEYMEYVYSNNDLYGRIKKIKEQLAKELKVYNIVCLKCNKELEPHTQEQHLDINHEIHRCETHHKIKKEIDLDPYNYCPTCSRRIGSHSIMEIYRCGLMTKEQTRDAIKQQYK